MDELLPAMKPGSCVAIHSTIHPDSCKALAAEAAVAEQGVHILVACETPVAVLLPLEHGKR